MKRLAASVRKRLPGPRWLVIAVPYLWMLLFFAIPFAIALKISFASAVIAMPPYTDLVNWSGDKLELSINTANYLFLVRDSLYVKAYLSSLEIAVVSTALCLLVGYPFAYFIARSAPSVRPALLMMVMLPFWTSFLLRVYAWKGILADQGVINNALMAVGLIDAPIVMLYTDVSMLVGMTYVYLPFMVLPLYATLVKMDFRLLEAAHDLGAGPWKAFWLITVPLSKAGIVSGAMLVFIPSVGEFVIPSLLGGAENIMIGRVVWDEMFSSNNWPRACALAVVMVCLILFPLALYYHYSAQTRAASAD